MWYQVGKIYTLLSAFCSYFILCLSVLSVISCLDRLSILSISMPGLSVLPTLKRNHDAADPAQVRDWVDLERPPILYGDRQNKLCEPGEALQTAMQQRIMDSTASPYLLPRSLCHVAD